MYLGTLILKLCINIIADLLLIFRLDGSLYHLAYCWEWAKELVQLWPLPRLLRWSLDSTQTESAPSWYILYTQIEILHYWLAWLIMMQGFFEVGGGLGFVIGPTLGGVLYEVSYVVHAVCVL